MYLKFDERFGKICKMSKQKKGKKLTGAFGGYIRNVMLI